VSQYVIERIKKLEENRKTMEEFLLRQIEMNDQAVQDVVSQQARTETYIQVGLLFSNSIQLCLIPITALRQYTYIVYKYLSFPRIFKRTLRIWYHSVKKWSRMLFPSSPL
jgi:hypothetical protein